VDAIKEWLREEYQWLLEQPNRGRQVVVAVEAGADVDVRPIWEPRFERAQRRMRELYEIVGCSRDEARRRAELNRARTYAIHHLSGERWPLRLGPVEVPVPSGRDRRGDPTSPRAIIIRLGLNFLNHEELAGVLGISVSAVKSVASRHWYKHRATISASPAQAAPSTKRRERSQPTIHDVLLASKTKTKTKT